MTLETIKTMVLTLPFRQGGMWRFFPAEVERACINEQVKRVVDYYGGAARWIILCDGGALDPAQWPLGLPPEPVVEPPPVVKPPEVLPPGVGQGGFPAVGEPPWVADLKRLLNEILKMVSK